MVYALDFCPRSARKETNVPLHLEKLRAYCPNIHTYCVLRYVSKIPAAVPRVFCSNSKHTRKVRAVHCVHTKSMYFSYKANVCLVPSALQGFRSRRGHGGGHAPQIFADQILLSQPDGQYIRDRPRFFDQVGRQTTTATIGNKHFFTKY